jgi:hypothetical protein
MPTVAGISLNVKDYGVTVAVPDDDVARLMYYLNCVTKGVGLDILQDDLIRYEKYRLLSPARIAVVFKTAVELSPDLFIGKILFRDDEGEVTGSSSNSFISISAACNVVSLQSNIVIAGKVQNVTKVMFFKSSWLKKYYTDPVERIARAILGTTHCTHCNGKDHICTCTGACRRPPESKCQPFLEALLDAFIPPPAPSSTREPSPLPDKDKHQCHCDGCGWQFFTGTRYRCTVCNDYDLCSPCYNRNVHDLTHPFKQINKPGGQPVHLSARRKAPTPSEKTPVSSTPKPNSWSVPPRNPPRSFLPRKRTEQTKSSVRFRKDDAVVLIGLNRGEMNGKTATVISVDHGEGKALVRVEVLDRTFKIKLENLMMQGELEELE